MPTSLRSNRHLSPRLVGWLEAVGIHSLEDLEALGPAEACCRMWGKFPGLVDERVVHRLHAALQVAEPEPAGFLQSRRDESR